MEIVLKLDSQIVEYTLGALKTRPMNECELAVGAIAGQFRAQMQAAVRRQLDGATDAASPEGEAASAAAAAVGDIKDRVKRGARPNGKATQPE